MFRELEADVRMPEDERRQDDRARVVIDLFFEGTDATGVASTKDISANGLYMNTLTVLSEGTLLMLRIPLGDEQLIVKAKVVYSNPGRGVGVHFYGLSDQDRAVLKRADLKRSLAAWTK
jgi:hypothetical protein